MSSILIFYIVTIKFILIAEDFTPILPLLHKMIKNSKGDDTLMQTEYIVSVPCTFMYLEADRNSEVTDQLLYGTCVTISEKAQNGFVFCKTDYGYGGYVEKSTLKKSDCTSQEKHVVTSSFCSLYSYPEYRCSPVLTLPKGSIIRSGNISIKNGFLGLWVDGRYLFAHKNHITSKEKLHAFHDIPSKRSQIVKTALSYLKTPYMWAGKTPSGIDCSGLCFMAYSMCGTGLYRDAEFDGRYLRKISKSELKKADLIYYNGHVVMYLGNGYYIHSSASMGGVTINSFDKNNPLYRRELDGNETCFASSLAFFES